ncbi:MAG: hypothetical protein B7C24_01145 [Bacteroidetes bacterium 4572_77]|nr:MAG: hypothetical protein B7C24_01145 [Bacteroidetes bacterium 4572_77]
MKNQNKKYIANFFLGIAQKSEQDKISKMPEVDHLLKQQWASSTPNKLDKAATKRLLHQTKNKITSSRKIRNINFIIKIAASLVLFFALGTSFYYLSPTKKSNIEIVSLSSPAGLRTKVLLPDSSTVILAGNSQISYPSNFDEKTRNVKIVGEAFFDVQKNPKKPFIVAVEDITISVLGTSFNILAYPEEESIETSLVTGKILVGFPNNPKSHGVTLSPGERSTYSKINKTVSISEFEINRTISWINEKLIFENENIFSICKKLERWYGIKINVHNSSKDKYTLTVQDNTLTEVLDLLAKVGPIQYEINNSKVDIYHK